MNTFIINNKSRGLKLRAFVLLLSILPLFATPQTQSGVNNEFNAPRKVEQGGFKFQRLFDSPYPQYESNLAGTNVLERSGVGGPVRSWTMNDYKLGHGMMDEIWWETQFSANMAFSYRIFGANGDEIVGQISIFPSKTKGYDAEVYLWLHSGKQDEVMDKQLFEVVEQWLASDWPFESVAYPGRKISWKKWAKR